MLGPARHGCKHLEAHSPRAPLEPAGRTMRAGSHRVRGWYPCRTPISTSTRCCRRTCVRACGGVREAGNRVQDRSIYERAEADPVAFWAEQADRLAWFHRWDAVMDRDPPWVKWFEGGALNASYNCLDRHVEAGGGDKVAYLWEGEPGDGPAHHLPGLLYDVDGSRTPSRVSACARATESRSTWGRSPSLPSRCSRARGSALPHSVSSSAGSRRVPQRSHQRRRGDGPDHRRTVATAAAPSCR